MSKFFVGQRVRLVRATRPENVGLEGRINRFEFTPRGTICRTGKPATIDCDCVVDYDTAGDCCDHTSRLEPIIPEGAAPSELSYTELMDRLKAGEVECV